jgi:hypothetical protein
MMMPTFGCIGPPRIAHCSWREEARILALMSTGSISIGAWRTGLFVLPLALAAWMGCSSSDSSAGGETPDAGPDAVVTPPGPPAPPPPPQTDGGAGLDCSNDTQADGLTRHLACSGLYADFAAKTLAPGVEPYKPAIEFWSDGAVKSRFLYIPPGTTIDDSNFDEWKWPDGTTAWKEFKVEGKRVETRIFKKVNGVFTSTTYIWTDDESDAVRSEKGKKVPVAGKPAYEVPSTGYCLECHQGKLDQLLGLEAVNLGIPGATGVTLATLAAKNLLSPPPPATALAIPDDPTIAAGKAPVALGWLHTNCGTCHNDIGAASITGVKFQIKATELSGAGAITDARQLAVYTTGVCKQASRVNPDAGVAWTLIAGQNPAESLVSVLSGSRAPEGTNPTVQTQMPPIVTHVVDTVGHQGLDDWINALPVCP